jgi:hypothetical protein
MTCSYNANYQRSSRTCIFTMIYIILRKLMKMYISSESECSIYHGFYPRFIYSLEKETQLNV